MTHLNPSRPWRSRAVALPLLVLVCSGLAACGSSSSTTGTGASAASTSSPGAAATSAPATKAAGTGSSTGSTASAGGGASSAGGGSSAASSSASPASGAFTARLAAMRTCLQKSGVTLPQGGSGGPGTMFRNPQLPKGMTRVQYAEALRKCGTESAGSSAALGKSRFRSTRFRQALVVFADCLRQNGIPVPQPNTSGKGPVFDTRGLDTTSPKFRQARQKCRSTLLGALRAAAHRGTH